MTTSQLKDECPKPSFFFFGSFTLAFTCFGCAGFFFLMPGSLSHSEWLFTLSLSSIVLNLTQMCLLQSLDDAFFLQNFLLKFRDQRVFGLQLPLVVLFAGPLTWLQTLTQSRKSKLPAGQPASCSLLSRKLPQGSPKHRFPAEVL